MLADSNVWLALVLSKHMFHEAVRTWLRAQRPGEILFCRATQHSLLRLLTTRAVMSPYGVRPLSNKAAWSAYAGFRADQRVAWADEPAGLELWWKKMAARPQASPKLWMDATSPHSRSQAAINLSRPTRRSSNSKGSP